MKAHTTREAEGAYPSVTSGTNQDGEMTTVPYALRLQEDIEAETNIVEVELEAATGTMLVGEAGQDRLSGAMDGIGAPVPEGGIQKKNSKCYSQSANLETSRKYRFYFWMKWIGESSLTSSLTHGLRLIGFAGLSYHMWNDHFVTEDSAVTCFC